MGRRRTIITKSACVRLTLLLFAGAILNVTVTLSTVYRLRIERDADMKKATQQAVMLAPYSVGRWAFAEFGQHGWPCSVVEGIDGFDVIWPGFAINTVFYAFASWLLLIAPFAWRRRRRIMRGLCVKCAYDLRGHPPSTTSDVCPECGAALLPSPSLLVRGREDGGEGANA